MPAISRGAKSGEICFFPLETKKTAFFAEIVKIQGDLDLPCPLPTPMLLNRKIIIMFLSQQAQKFTYFTQKNNKLRNVQCCQSTSLLHCTENGLW